MANLLRLNLATPEQSVFTDDVKMVVAPAAEGDIGILPHHTTIITILRAGIIEVHQADGEVTKYYANNGYLSMMNNNCTILAQTLVEKSALSKELLQNQITELQQKISNMQDETQIELLQMRLVEAENAILLVY